MDRKAVVLLGLLLVASHLFAQDGNKKAEKAQVYTFEAGGGMDAYSNGVPDNVQLLYFPEFYSHGTKHKDTVFKFECYDSRDSILTHVKENSEIRFISVFKSYDDPVHTYVDNGVKKALPISSIIRRYDRVGDDQWISVDYATNKVANLKEYRNQIVRSDSVIILDPINNKELITIYSYYKVEVLK